MSDYIDREQDVTDPTRPPRLTRAVSVTTTPGAAEVRRLREALAWYADDANYDEEGVPGWGSTHSPHGEPDEYEWTADCGVTARRALDSDGTR